MNGGGEEHLDSDRIILYSHDNTRDVRMLYYDKANDCKIDFETEENQNGIFLMLHHCDIFCKYQYSEG